MLGSFDSILGSMPTDPLPVSSSSWSSFPMPTMDSSNYPISSFPTYFSSSDSSEWGYQDDDYYNDFFNYTDCPSSKPNFNSFGMNGMNDWLTNLMSGLAPQQVFSTNNYGGQGMVPFRQSNNPFGGSFYFGGPVPSRSNNGRFNSFQNPYASYGFGNFAFNPSFGQGGRGNRGNGWSSWNNGRGNSYQNVGPNFDYYGFGSSGSNYGSNNNGFQNGMRYPSYQGSGYMSSGNTPYYWYFA